MNIAVMGAGAVGCFYGAMLARAGHAVVMIGRAGHVAAMRERGLRLETAAGTEAVAVAAQEGPEGVTGADTVFVAVKSDDAEATGRAIAPHLAPGATVVSLQNGVDTAAHLEAALGRPVVAAAVYVAVEMAGPGHVRHHGRGELAIAAGPESERLAATLRAAGIPTDVSDDVQGVLWTKLIVNCAYNGLSAVPQLPYGRLVAVPGIVELMDEIVTECLAVARRLGVHVAGDPREAVRRLGPSMPGQSSSTAQDLARGRRTEIDHLNGYIVRTGARLDLPTPANRAIWSMVKLMEDKAAAP